MNGNNSPGFQSPDMPSLVRPARTELRGSIMPVLPHRNTKYPMVIHIGHDAVNESKGLNTAPRNDAKLKHQHNGSAMIRVWERCSRREPRS